VDLRGLEAIVAVNQHGSFSAAATALFISQPALTRRVALLERELDLKLFTRTSRGVYLTDAGRAVIEPATRALRETDHLRKALEQIHGGDRGSLNLTAMPGVSVSHVGRLIARFHEARPHVDVKVTSCDSTSSAIAELEAGAHDLAIIDRPVHSDSVCSVDIFSDDFLAVYTPKFGKEVSTTTIPIASAEMFAGRPLIHLTDALYPRQQGRRFFEMLGIEPSSTIETQHPEMLVPIARGGFGVAVVPRDVAMMARAAGSHVAEPPQPIRRVVGLARRKDETSPTIALFLKLALTEFRALNRASAEESMAS
jgi:DNA-binding transcriptional LysR family regulator